MTGLSLFRTSASKVSSVTTLVVPTAITSLSLLCLLVLLNCSGSPVLASQRSASMAAAQPVPAAVTACR